MEQNPPDTPITRPSKRHQLITKFLQEAARIVPMESIFSAIAYCNSQDTMIKCARAVMGASASVLSPFPISKLAEIGCKEAEFRLVTGLPPPPNFFLQHGTIPDKSINPKKVRKDPMYSTVLKSGAEELFNPLYVRELYSRIKPLLKISDDNKEQTIITRFFSELSRELEQRASKLLAKRKLNLISEHSIGETYPISKSLSHEVANPLTPLPEILRQAKRGLSAEANKQRENPFSPKATLNISMLKQIQRLLEDSLQPCVTMLGGFMEQQMRVPLVNNPLDTARALRTTDSSTGAVGVWALFALNKYEIHDIVSKTKNQSLIVQITKYIQGVLSSGEDGQLDKDTQYAAKLEFLLLGISMNKTVTCSHQYISYSLERELVKLCKVFKITTSTKVQQLLGEWDDKFQETALSLVPNTHRSLLARWLIWSLHIHHLRESLAKYITIGVIGLVNSGKSTLVHTLFKREVKYT